MVPEVAGGVRALGAHAAAGELPFLTLGGPNLAKRTAEAMRSFPKKSV